MILPSQRFREGVHDLKGKFVKPPTHIVQLNCIFLVNSLKATLTAIVDGVAEILVVLHNHNNLVFVREQAPSILGQLYYFINSAIRCLAKAGLVEGIGFSP